eukprot:jgi/Mesvir1/8542/Mv03071-RA.1
MPEMEVNPSDRATAIALRTYHRPLDDGSGGLESWDQVVARVIDHQRWLWIRAKDAPLTADEEKELDELKFTINMPATVAKAPPTASTPYRLAKSVALSLKLFEAASLTASADLPAALACSAFWRA